MGSLSNHFDIVVTADSVSVARAGRIPLILAVTAAPFSDSLIRRYNSQSAVLVDWAATTPEARAAAAAFGQNPRPKEIMIARSTLPPTIVYQIDVLSVRSSFKYQLKVKGEGGVVDTTAEDTSDSSATNDEIVALLVTKLNAVSGKNYTAAATGSVGSQVVTVTATAARDWFSIESVDVTALGVRMIHVDPGVATDLAAALLENDEWYWLYTLANSEPYATAAAAWAQSNRKLYFVQSSDTRDLGTSTGTNGLLDILKAAGRTYVAGDYHPASDQMAMAALLGNLAPRVPGSYTAKFKKRAGITGLTFTATQRANLVARYANFYEKVTATVTITSEGTTSAGPSDIRGFIDNVVFLDWLENDMGSQIFGDVASQDKVPRTNAGMTVIENSMWGSLGRGVAVGGIAELTADQNDGIPSPNVVIPDIADMDDLLPRGVRASASFKLAGAIHSGDIGLAVVL